MHTSVPKNVRRSILSQHDSNDCGAACLLSVIRYYGGDINLEFLKSVSGTTKNGTTLLGLQEAFEEVGITSSGYLASIDNLKEEKRPTILHVRIDQSFNHYIACYGYKNDRFQIVDPLIGYTEYTEEELDEVWESKRLLLVEESKVFVEKTGLLGNHQWFIDVLKRNSDRLFLALFLGFIVSILTLSTAFFIEQMVNKYLSRKLVVESVEFIFLWLFLLVAKEAFTYVRAHIIIKQIFELNIDLLGQYFSKLISMNIRFFDSKQVGDLVARMNDAEIIEDTTIKLIGQSLIDLLVVMIVLVYAFIINVGLGLIILGGVVLFLSIAILNNSRIIKLQQEQVITHSKRESTFIDVFNNIEIIKSYAVEAKYLKQIIHEYAGFEAKRKDLNHFINRYNVTINLAKLFILLSSFLYISADILNGETKVGTLFAVFVLVSFFNVSIRELIVLNINLQGTLVAVTRLRDFIQLDSSTHSPTVDQASIELELDNHEPYPILQLKDVSFKFPGYLPIIQNVNLTIDNPGVYCLIGKNGTGKSTFLKVLKNLYQVTNGEVFISGKAMSNLSTYQLNESVALVEQNPKVINGSVYENLTIGNALRYEEIIESISAYGLLNFIQQFPEGLDTKVGSGGLPISTGQKQMISILRGVLVSPKILLFDEPTASIDSNYRTLYFQMIENLKKDTVIVISSHDQELIDRSDQVLMFNNGAIMDRNVTLAAQEPVS